VVDLQLGQNHCPNLPEGSGQSCTGHHQETFPPHG
jgi:hypothetical protein